MDLALALMPLLLANGFEKLDNFENTYQHQSTWKVTLDPGTENWIAIWDDKHAVVCEARVSSPAQAILLLGVFNLLKGVEVQ